MTESVYCRTDREPPHKAAADAQPVANTLEEGTCGHPPCPAYYKQKTDCVPITKPAECEQQSPGATLERRPSKTPLPNQIQEGTPGRPPDELDQLVATATANFLASTTWSQFFDLQRDPRGDWGDVGRLDHPAAQLLELYRKQGVPVQMTTPQWDMGRRLAALQRGPHKSAKEHIPFLREEYVDMIKKGHWVLLPARLLLPQPELRLSPLGVVPQRDRRPRTISDYSYWLVNADTLKLAPQEAMQFGRALQRILQKIHDANPRFGPVYMCKIDISDGFYRVGICPEDAIKLAILFPCRESEEPLIGLPLTLPMGWAESPPAFCTATETSTDLANTMIARDWHKLAQLPHRHDAISETLPSPEPDSQPSRRPRLNLTPVPTTTQGPHYQRPLAYWDVYVDDHLGLAQGNAPTRRRVKRAMFHALDKVFRPLGQGDNPFRQEPASLKKLRKGDATWSTRKIMLGWQLDTVQGTIALPTHRIERLHTILNSVRPKQKVIATKDWHKVLGELRSMALAIPGARGLFSILQEAFRHPEAHRPRIRLNKATHVFLEDFRWLAREVASRPTRIAELVPSLPSVYGACDAAGTGMGGVFFYPDKNNQPQACLWRAPFSQKIQEALASWNNPTGPITNSDLELCGNMAHHAVIAAHVDVREHTLWTASDNMANVHWMRKGSTTTVGPAAYLLRLQSHHQRIHRYVPTHDYIPGPANAMADLCSRAWHLTDSQLLHHFNTTYPQKHTWHVCQLNSDLNLELISALWRTATPMMSLPKTPSPRIPLGTFGIDSVRPTQSIHTSKILKPAKILSLSSSSSPSSTARESCPPAASLSDLNVWRTPFVRWVRRSPGWGPRTPEKAPTASWSPGLPPCSAALPRKTPPPLESALSQLA